MGITNGAFRIPAGAAAHEVQAKFTYPIDTKLLAMSPHMHLRGKSMKYTAIYPTGERQVLLDVPNYDFNWQIFYYVDKAIDLPKGTRIEVDATFDNSPNNPKNPDATKEVKWGDQSWQEMVVGFVDVLIPATMNPMDLYRNRPQPKPAE